LESVNRSGEYTVYFGHGWPESGAARSVLVRPSDDRWNDFSFRTRVTYEVRSDEGSVGPFEGCLGFLSEEERPSDLTYLTELLASRGSPLAAEEVPGRFFTMLATLADYRKLVDALETKQARLLLHSLNDVVATSEFWPTTLWLDDALSSDVFNMSFLRSSESFFTFKNAGPLLRGARYEEFNLSSTSLAVELPRDNMPVVELTFQFDHDGVLPKRMAVVIGKNGVGKSQTLSHIARTALARDKTLKDASGDRFMFTRLLAFAPTNEAEQVFPIAPHGRTHVWYRRYSLNRTRRSKRNQYVTDLLVQLARSDQRLGDQTRWQIFVEAITALDGWEQIVIPVRNERRTYLPLTELRRSGEMRSLQTYAMIDGTRPPRRQLEDGAYELSSGEISFLTFAAQVCLDIENGSLLLLDEPETHLHPQLISSFSSLLNSLLAATGSIAILATHSVFVVREVFREQVTVLRRSPEGFTVSARPTLRTFGADPGAISFFVFGEDQPSSLANEVKANLAATDMSWEELYEEYGDELSLEFMGELRNTTDEQDLSE
jgi:ABC-type dipeptide/oligopeptide/nickel transport system ATPase component